MSDTPLQEALYAGDISSVRDLIAAGEDIRYKRDKGYDAIIDAVHGPGVTLLEILSLLIESGVDLNGESSYGESGLRIASRIGRFDVVRLLLNAGADKQHLQWTPLLEATALGSVHDVRAVLAQGADLEAKDYWSRSGARVSIAHSHIAHGAARYARQRARDDLQASSLNRESARNSSVGRKNHHDGR